MNDTGSVKNNLIAAERRRVIYNLTLEQQSVNAVDLAEAFGVGISTIRRDLDALDNEGMLLRVHGGALVNEPAAPRTPYRQSRGQHSAEKSVIAEAALEYLPENGTVFIGGGTTTLQLATRLPRERDICVITNGLDIAARIASNNLATVDFVGGTIRPDSLQSNCEEALETLYWDVTFMGLAAVDGLRGITTDNRSTAHQEKLILKHGNTFVALCDSSKVGRFAYAQVAPVSAMDVFVTDDKVDADFVRQLEEAGIKVVIASAHKTGGNGNGGYGVG